MLPFLGLPEALYTGSTSRWCFGSSGRGAQECTRHSRGHAVRCRRCADAALTVAIDRQTLDVDDAAPDAFIGFALATDAQRQRVAHEAVGIEAANAIAIDNRSEVHQVHQRVALIEFLALQHPADECLRCRTIPRRVLAASFVHPSCSGDAGQFLQRLGGQLPAESFALALHLLPKSLAIRRIHHIGLHASPHEFGAHLLYLGRHQHVYLFLFLHRFPF